jgi:hypothetical protein
MRIFIRKKKILNFMADQMPMPSHLIATGNLFTLLSTFVALHDLGQVDVEKAKAARFHPDQMQHPAPDLIVEVISKGTAARDRGIKYEDYAAHGVKEYWIIDPDRQTAEQYLLDHELMEYNQKKLLSIKDTLDSIIVPGFFVPLKAIFDKQANLAFLKTMISEETG